MKIQNSNRFTKESFFYFRRIGFDLEKKSQWTGIKLCLALINMSALSLRFILNLLFFENNTLIEITQNVVFTNYCCLGILKYIVMIYNRKKIKSFLDELKEIYPPEELEKAYGADKFLNQHLLIESVLIKFYKFGTFFFVFLPLMLSFIDLIRTGTFSYKLPFMLRVDFGSLTCGWLIYFIDYVQLLIAINVASISLLVLDLCHFCALQQLCMHFYIIQKNILKIQPDESDKAVKLLIEQIIYHQKIIGLAEKLNTVFTPSVLFSLLSSSLIICFMGYQLLGELSVLIVVKAIFLLAYELKQVALICFLGDKLIEISLNISDAVYEHKWYNGTPKYRRLVLMVLMRSQHSVALHIAGISDISLQTFRKVMSISYQVFTVLRSK